MSVTEDDLETMNDPQQPDLILPQNPQEKTEEEGPEAEVKDTPKSDDDHLCAGSDQDTYHPTGESPRVETTPPRASVTTALERSQAVLNKTKTD